MDDRRFDSLARAVGGLGSRRAILRGLFGIATLAAWGRQSSDASAQRGALGPGDACYDDSQCSQAVADYSPLVCSDNGFDYDGPFNCCTGVGGFCYSDEGCCGWAFCDANQRCSSTTSSPSYPSFDVRNPGDPCQTTDQCQRPVTGAICEYTNSTGDSRCCWYEGSLCTSGAQCCGSRVCANGVCQFSGGGSGPSGGGTAAPGELCRPGVDTCVYASGAFSCDFVGSTGDYRCCAYGGDRCGWDGECCGDSGCVNGVCQGMAGGSFTCGGVGCSCVGGISQCDRGLMCCVQGDVGATGVCLSVDTCYASGPGCTTEGCTCAVQNPYACDGDLICCGPGELNATGTCQYRWNC